MGLDQYAYRVKKNAVISDLDFKSEIDGEETYTQIYYWRKVPYLQGFMEKLYREKGGEDTFNCRVVRLTTKDLNRLKRCVKNGCLPVTSGFFFGYHHEEDMKYVLDFVDKAKDVIKSGDAVYYDSWW